jgi:hypothetical protein
VIIQRFAVDWNPLDYQCMADHFNDFIKCYTGGENNRGCCIGGGVVGLLGICQNLCDGTQDYPDGPLDKLQYTICTPWIGVISPCNHDSLKQMITNQTGECLMYGPVLTGIWTSVNWANTGPYSYGYSEAFDISDLDEGRHDSSNDSVEHVTGESQQYVPYHYLL